MRGTIFFGIEEMRALFRSVIVDESIQLENEFSRYIGVTYSVATNFGRTALYAAVQAVGCTGKEVIIPALTCDVVTQAVMDAGASPVFVDVNPDTLEIDITDLEKKITKKTRALIVIHYFGKPAGNILDIAKYTRNQNIVLIEDCAHALGAQIWGKNVGLFGDISIFSLTKTMLNTDGGMFCTSNEHYYTFAKELFSRDSRTRLQHFNDFLRIIVHGYKSTVDKVILDRIGTTKYCRFYFRFMDIFPDGILRLFYLIEKKYLKAPPRSIYRKISSTGAAIGRVQLTRLPCLKEHRNKIFYILKCQSGRYYFEDKDDNNAKNAWMDFPMKFLCVSHDLVIRFFNQQGITLRPTWPVYQEGLNGQDTKNTQKIMNQILLWRIHPQTSEKEIKKIIETCNKFTEFFEF